MEAGGVEPPSCDDFFSSVYVCVPVITGYPVRAPLDKPRPDYRRPRDLPGICPIKVMPASPIGVGVRYFHLSLGLGGEGFRKSPRECKHRCVRKYVF